FPMIIQQLKAGKRIDQYITQRLTKNKKIVDVSISISPIRDNSGKLIGALKIARDITESTKIRNQLAHLASLVESSGDSIWSIDKSGKIVSWNKGAEELYDYEAKEVLGKTPDSVIAPDYLEEFYEFAHKLWNGETVENYDSARIRKDGSRVEVSVSMSPVKNNHGETEGISIVARNITERKKLEQRKDDFIALASHELKTPVTSLKMFTQVMESRFKKTGDLASARYMESMDNQINKLTEIVNGLLDVSRVSQGKLTYKNEPFSIKELVQETIESMQMITNTHRIEISGDTNKYIIGDKDRIEQVLINLINNAIKYSPKARKVIVELKNQNGGVLVSVTDFGMGIPKRDESKVFDRFFQADTPLVKTYPGLGLGLYISKEIVNRHGGKLWVKSTEGKGSIFYVLLPGAN
ncbi:MAG: PAS domain S-box protein, partial [Patescibacteria group bacterium]|nr:PAS domain S-box protein [Patescibacteria group bacterium]